MALVIARDVTLGFAGPPVLERVELRIEPGEHVGLLGRNGTGKSTLLRVLDGQVQPDEGDIIRQQGLRTALLAQEVPRALASTVFDEVASGLARHGRLSREHHRQVDEILSRMQLDPEAKLPALSAGMKRRVLLARALAGRPDLLLLDEPTNHLDIASVEWVEEFLLRHAGAILFVTHDRVLLSRLAGRILDLDRGRLTSWTCDYPTYLRRKEAALAAEAKQNALFDKRLAREEAWIRRGIEARRTRNEGRVRALVEMRRVRARRRDREGQTQIQIQEAERSGQLVIEARGVSFGYGAEPVIRDLATTIFRGDRVGILGPNGSGKTTLLRLLLGRLAPQQGTLRHGTGLEIAYFDQLQEQLDPERTVQENVSPGTDTLRIGGQRRHVIGYLEDFLFTPDQARQPTKFLSGGEHNRLLLARLFTQPFNLLVMDEPTNDLDVETLELLEERLLEYQGTLLLVSHDRQFINNVVTSTLVLEGEGQVKEYAGGYDDWLAQRGAAGGATLSKARGAAGRSGNSITPLPSSGRANPSSGRVAPPKPPARRMTYAQKLELEALPGRIESLEAELARRHATMAQPDFYRQPRETIARATAELRAVEDELAEAFRRWETLESIER